MDNFNIFKQTWVVFGRNLSSFVGVVALTVGGVVLLWLVVWILLPADTAGVPFIEVWGQLTWVYKLVIGASAIAFPFLAVRVIATTVHLASESHLGRKIGMRESYGLVRRKTLGVVWLLFVPLFLGPAMPIGAIIITFFVGPGIPLAILEDRKLAAIGRGWALSKGRKGSLYLLWILAWILLAITSAACMVLFDLVSAVVPYHPVRNIALFYSDAVLACIVGQLWIIALTLHYYDCTADRANSTPTLATHL